MQIRRLPVALPIRSGVMCPAITDSQMLPGDHYSSALLGGG
ncbi:hypothetical protein ACE7GA_26555 (plasmid) [Roseomonas sp. CCTCC AB2023176]